LLINNNALNARYEPCLLIGVKKPAVKRAYYLSV
jgi:hypothetical protein